MDELAKIIHDVLENDDDSEGGGYARAANAVRAYLESDEVVAEILRVFDGGIVYEPHPKRPGGMVAYWKPSLAMRAALQAAGGKGDG